MDPTRFHQQFAEDLRHQVNITRSQHSRSSSSSVVIVMTLPIDTTGTIWDGWGQLGRSLKGFLCILPNQLGCRAPHFYRCVLFEPTLSTASLSSPSPQGSTWEAQGGAIPSTTPSHSKDKARSVDIRSKFQSVQNFNPFKISICSKFQSVQSFNPFKVSIRSKLS